MTRFFIIYNRTKEEGGSEAAAYKDFIEENGAFASLWQSDIEGGVEIQPPEDTDCVIVLGGDGTMLRAARLLKSKDIPILGINMGHLGYLTEGDKDSARDIIRKVISGTYVIEDRIMLSGRIMRGSATVAQDIALNDITVTRSRSLKTINFKLSVNGELLYRYTADGIIISTPTGSTAYNLSCGGPIVEPTAKLFLVTPIAPHSLNNRSLVLSSEDVIDLEISDNNDDPALELEYCAYFDGDSTFRLMPGDRIEIVRAPRMTHILKLSNRSFLDTLRKKMTI